jgi:hypothetical protein
MPAEGGSYVREADGTLRRTEWTRQPGEPEPTPAEPDRPRRVIGKARTAPPAKEE